MIDDPGRKVMEMVKKTSWLVSISCCAIWLIEMFHMTSFSGGRERGGCWSDSDLSCRAILKMRMLTYKTSLSRFDIFLQQACNSKHAMQFRVCACCPAAKKFPVRWCDVLIGWSAPIKSLPLFVGLLDCVNFSFPAILGPALLHWHLASYIITPSGRLTCFEFQNVLYVFFSILWGSCLIHETPQVRALSWLSMQSES